MATQDTLSTSQQQALEHSVSQEFSEESPNNSHQVDQIPAGGQDSTKFDGREAWYPIYYLEDLDQSKPTTFTLMGEDLVIWWDKTDQTWRVFEDKCPHRLAPLSEGRIAEDGLLECPYHGWAFSGAGNCDRIPQHDQGTANVSRRACATTLPTAAHQGLLFVYPGQPENAANVRVPTIQALEEATDEWVCINTFRDLPYDALTLMENVLDASHIPYTHHRSVGNRSNAGPVELEVVTSGRQGFQGLWQEGPRRGSLGRQDTHFMAPGLMWHDLTSKQFGRTLTVVYATPIRKGECRIFARFPFKFATKWPGRLIRWTPRWYSHIGQNSVLEDDQIFLHKQERYLEAAGGSGCFAQAFYLPTQADAFVAELRKWVNDYQADPFEGEALPPALPPDKLLDRYYSHTIKCASCRRALARVQQLRIVLVLVAAILLALLGGTVIAAGATLVVVLAWFGLGRLEKQFYQGRELPPRNRPEK